MGRGSTTSRTRGILNQWGRRLKPCCAFPPTPREKSLGAALESLDKSSYDKREKDQSGQRFT